MSITAVSKDLMPISSRLLGKILPKFDSDERMFFSYIWIDCFVTSFQCFSNCWETNIIYGYGSLSFPSTKFLHCMDWYRKIVLVFAIDIIYHNISQEELMEFGQTFDELSRPYFSYNGTFHTICTHTIFVESVI